MLMAYFHNLCLGFYLWYFYLTFLKAWHWASVTSCMSQLLQTNVLLIALSPLGSLVILFIYEWNIFFCWLFPQSSLICDIFLDWIFLIKQQNIFSKIGALGCLPHKDSDFYNQLRTGLARLPNIPAMTAKWKVDNATNNDIVQYQFYHISLGFF